MKVKIADNVLILKGKYRGKTGKILKTFKKVNKIVVEKINVKIRHIKKKSNRPGERIQFEAPIDASNAKIICPHCNKATRIEYKISTEGKERICKKCKISIDEKK